MNTRKAEILVDGEWNPIHFLGIRKGDKFRLFESTGEPVIGTEGMIEFEALGDAYTNTKGVYCVLSNF